MPRTKRTMSPKRLIPAAALLAMFLALIPGCRPSQRTRVVLGDAAAWTNRLNAPDLTEPQFVQLYAEGILRRFPDASVEIVAPGEIRVTRTSGKPATSRTRPRRRRAVSFLPSRPP